MQLLVFEPYGILYAQLYQLEVGIKFIEQQLFIEFETGLGFLEMQVQVLLALMVGFGYLQVVQYQLFEFQAKLTVFWVVFFGLLFQAFGQEQVDTAIFVFFDVDFALLNFYFLHLIASCYDIGIVKSQVYVVEAINRLEGIGLRGVQGQVLEVYGNVREVGEYVYFHTSQAGIALHRIVELLQSIACQYLLVSVQIGAQACNTYYQNK